MILLNQFVRVILIVAHFFGAIAYGHDTETDNDHAKAVPNKPHIIMIVADDMVEKKFKFCYSAFVF